MSTMTTHSAAMKAKTGERVDAYEWCTAILNEYRYVATPDQLKAARGYVYGPTPLQGLRINPVAPPLSELQARLEARDTPEAPRRKRPSRGKSNRTRTAQLPLAPEPEEAAPVPQAVVEIATDPIEAGLPIEEPPPAQPTPADWAEYAAWAGGAVSGAESDPAASLFTLDQWVDEQARRYRRLETRAGDLVAEHLAELARLIRFVQATTPRTAADRIATLERDHHSDRTLTWRVAEALGATPG